jgi:putative endonuclease
MKNIETGKIGENIACRYLLKNSYLILARNHKERFDEIDIIARDHLGILVFCEVKTGNRNNNGFMPEDNLSMAKRKKTIRASSIFLARHPELVWENAGWQIDLIAIVLDGGKLSDLRHYKNI